MQSVLLLWLLFLFSSEITFLVDLYHETRSFLRAGFERLSETEDWAARIQPNGSYFFTRNESAIVSADVDSVMFI